MTMINLLPWRELRREREKKRFTGYLVSTFVMALLLVLVVNYHFDKKIDEQTTLNRRLETEITEFKKQIAVIQNLKTLREGLIARMDIVQNLQATRTLTVRLFDELIHILPDGVYVNRMERVKNKITLLGYTESNSNISRMMFNIESSQWIQSPQLTEIKKTTKDGHDDASSEFILSFILKPKKASA